MPAEKPRAKAVDRPPHLSLDAIIAAAERILQTGGAEKISMRRLATELNSAPMALYYTEQQRSRRPLCTPERAVFIYRTIWYSIFGDLMIRVNGNRRRGRATGPTHEDQVVAGLMSGTHPHLAAVADQWAELNALTRIGRV